MTKKEIAKKLAEKIRKEKFNKTEFKKIKKEIENLTYEETDRKISHEEVITILKEILKELTGENLSEGRVLVFKSENNNLTDWIKAFQEETQKN